MAPRDRAPENPNPGTSSPFLAGGDPAEYQTTPDEEAISEIDRLVNEAGPESGYQVALYRKSGDGLRYNYIRRLPLVGFEIDKLPETYGGGQYLLRVNNERNRIVKTLRIAFDPTVHPLTPPTPAPAGASTSTGGMPGDMRELVLQMARDRDQDRKDHQAFLQTMVTALLTKNTTSNTPTIGELMDAQLKMRELAAPAGKGEPEVILQALKLGLETAAGRAPGGDDAEGGADIFTKLIDKIGVPLIEAIQRRSSAPTRAPAPGGALPARGAAGGAPAQATGLPPELEPFAFLRQWTPYLLGWGKTSFDPARAAAVIYNVVPDPYFPVLEDFLSKTPAERFSILVQLDPRLQAYQDYTERITTALKAEIGDDDTDAGELAPGDQGSDQP